jgi:hypothetical protein
MLGEARLDDLAPEGSDASEGRLLIALHQRRETGDIGSQNGSKASSGHFAKTALLSLQSPDIGYPVGVLQHDDQFQG